MKNTNQPHNVRVKRQLSDSICPQGTADAGKALRACFLRNMNQHFGGVSIPISKKHYKQFQVLLEAITEALLPHVYLKSAITKIYRINGMQILSIDDFFEDDIVVCCCQYEAFVDVGYNVKRNYMRFLGSLIQMRDKLLPTVDQRDSDKGKFKCLIDYKKCQLPQAILLYIDVTNTIRENKSTVIFEGYGRARKDKHYIIKMVDKEQMCLQTYGTYLEIDILRQLQNHRNIIDLVYTVEQFKYTYIVVERLGCNLHELIKQRKTFPESMVKNVMKDVSEGLKYIHECHIIHRDLKLDNLLVQFDYSVALEPSIVVVKITDFGLATYYKGSKLYQGCGTPHYMAPEVINCAGYDYSVDLWSLGVALFYMLFNELPFGHSETNIFTIFKSIQTIRHQIPFDSELKVSSHALHLVNSLLVKLPQHRLSINEVCQHPFLCDARGDTLVVSLDSHSPASASKQKQMG